MIKEAPGNILVACDVACFLAWVAAGSLKINVTKEASQGEERGNTSHLDIAAVGAAPGVWLAGKQAEARAAAAAAPAAGLTAACSPAAGPGTAPQLWPPPAPGRAGPERAAAAWEPSACSACSRSVPAFRTAGTAAAADAGRVGVPVRSAGERQRTAVAGLRASSVACSSGARHSAAVAGSEGEPAHTPDARHCAAAAAAAEVRPKSVGS